MNILNILKKTHKKISNEVDTTVLLTRCINKQFYGVKVQKMQDGDWWRTFAFPVNDSRAKNERYEQDQIQGSLRCTAEYPGCPYCGAKSFVLCNKCHKMTCYQGETTLLCSWCGNHMDNITTTTQFTLSGGDI